MYYFGICLLVWLSAGLLTGLRVAVVERKEYNRRMLVMREAAKSDQQLHLVNFFTFRRNFIAASTLLGLFAFWLDMVSIVRDAKKSFADKQSTRKK